MRVREPCVAGMFYPSRSDQCLRDVRAFLEGVSPIDQGEVRPIGGLVPHAGWAYSGAVAARVFKTLMTPGAPRIVVLLGAVHRSSSRGVAIFGSGRWETPLGPLTIDQRLAERICGHTNLIVDDPYAHENEHSIEVQMPFIKELLPEAKIVPIMVPPSDKASEVGVAVARTLRAYDYEALIVGTTDLTHYGPNYGFTPRGVGEEGNLWAKRENDKRFIDLVCALKHDRVVPEALEHHNACGSGAVAATLAAVEALGASKGILLEHTTSSEVVGSGSSRTDDNSVGYAGVVFV